ncbi:MULTISPECIES: TetR/AcrR family transcriptional regulator [Mycolicibacterium]|jgi:AcrR family transcriptional regulator|uniref:TetR/AcrR family transcriptional regulator n=1 Tax=Mycolicibacterium TaxID=1866885 RepID=UPI000CF97B28|nr:MULTISPECIES: TetR/AcrR family transcriptional regulator [Mycolicibacterium]MDW5614975.1 TetR/AcrR family transcriptional regulator [Mycolicibacterium sp. D5.8-2]PQP51236.1 TetR/AcrR family transcriptional regulator [Mycolicibacterium austroafricanum]
MPRVVKPKDVRRAEVLDRALALFLERGYENVSLNDLLAVSGTSKGAFYHYFPSKEALVVALAQRSAGEAFEVLRPVFDQPGKNALERLNAGLTASYQVKLGMGAPEPIAAMRSLLMPENQALFRKIVTIWEDLFRPVLTEVITQGVREGVFDTFDPEGVGDMIQGFAASIQDYLVRMFDAADAKSRRKTIDDCVKRLKLYGIATDRILGLPDGATVVLERKQVEAMMTLFMPSRPAGSLP